MVQYEGADADAQGLQEAAWAAGLQIRYNGIKVPYREVSSKKGERTNDPFGSMLGASDCWDSCSPWERRW